MAAEAQRGPEIVLSELRECLPDSPEAPGRARELVRRALEDWALLEVADDVELAVSELVTNAHQHGLPPIVLRLCRSAMHLRVDITDARPYAGEREARVVRRDHDESGRGQGIVRAVSDRSGTEQTGTSGKSSFALWDVAPIPAGSWRSSAPE